MRMLIVLALMLSITACSTVWGVGKDISDAAEWTHDKMTKPAKTEPVKQEPAR